MKIIFILSIILYQFAEGCTEGYTWANKTRRKENWLICGNFGGGDKGILDYHAWRICESIGIMGMILTFEWSYFWSLVGTVLFNMFWTYQMALDKVSHNDWFYVSSGRYFHILWWSIPRNSYVERCLGLMGILMF